MTGDWLAGFTDGEGCFSIYRTRTGFACKFAIALRADDAVVLNEIRDFIGHGAISARNPQSVGGKPQLRLQVQSRAGCERVVEIFSAHPLRSKKARDFERWARAVRLWALAQHGGNGRSHNSEVWDAMRMLHDDLREVRAFREVA